MFVIYIIYRIFRFTCCMASFGRMRALALALLATQCLGFVRHDVPRSLELIQNSYVPTEEVRWSNHDFFAGVAFGVLACCLLLALLLGCGLLKLAKPEESAEPRVEHVAAVEGEEAPRAKLAVARSFWPFFLLKSQEFFA